MEESFATCFLCDRTYCKEVDGQRLVWSATCPDAYICLWCVERCQNTLELDKRIPNSRKRAAFKDIMNQLGKESKCSFCSQKYDPLEAPGLQANLIGNIVGRNEIRVCPLCIRRFHLDVTLIGHDHLNELFAKNVVRKLKTKYNLMSMLVEVVQAETHEPCSLRTIAPLSAKHLLVFQRLTWLIDRHGEEQVAEFMIELLSGKPEQELLRCHPQMTRDYRKYKTRVPISETSVDQAFSDHLEVGEHIARDQFWASLLRAERSAGKNDGS